ncbi:DUF11 domain-containing protein [Spirillospora sp. CA-128828]|uniref:DUF11 domain-containing protein n=1 Tax=Spirillospora sp. CA-128828 TaxID=3240033 RepID=UPI003D8AF36D
MIRTWKGRGLVPLTAAALLGAVPIAAGAYAAGPGPAAPDGHHDAASKPPPRPRTHAKPKPRKLSKKAAAVTLQTRSPGRKVIPGRTYEWTFRMTAKGPKWSGKAMFRTTLPASLAFASGVKGCASKGRTVECDLGTVRRGRTVTGAIRAKVVRRARPGQKIRVRGAVTWGGALITWGFPAVRVARAADLVLSKAAPSTARAGTKILYVMKVRNLGPSDAENVTVESKGPIKIIGRDATCIPRGRGYVCSVGPLRKGESRTLHLRAVPRGDVRAGTVVETWWMAVSGTLDPNEGNNGATVRTKITKRAGGAGPRPRATQRSRPVA